MHYRIGVLGISVHIMMNDTKRAKPCKCQLQQPRIQTGLLVACLKDSKKYNRYQGYMHTFYGFLFTDWTC